MTKEELERENYHLKEKVRSLQKFQQKWAPMAAAIETIIEDKIDANEYRWKDK